MNIYDSCPELSDDAYRIRLIEPRDAEDLLAVYSDKLALPFFNSDNCHGANFYCRTLHDVQESIKYWLIEYHENVNGTTGYHVWNMRELTPEQAITATQGSGTCKDVCNSVSEFTCSVCGFNCDLTSWISLFDGDDGRHRHHHHGTPNYCPNCGARVVGA